MLFLQMLKVRILNSKVFTLNGANFDNAKMPRANFNGAGMHDGSMVNAYLPEASFNFANIIHSDLQKC